MTSIKDLNSCECAKYDPLCIDAFFTYSLLPEDPSTLVFDNSWGSSQLDLTPAVQNAETITHLALTDNALQFEREDYGREGALNGGIDCINGDALSRIVSMQLLKDVSQTEKPTNGSTYMYNGTLGLFEPYNLQSFITQTNNAISTLQTQVGILTQQIQNLQTANQQILENIAALNNRLATTEINVSQLQSGLAEAQSALSRPSWAPANATLAWGTINNTYQGATSSQGIFTHNPATRATGDQNFN